MKKKFETKGSTNYFLLFFIICFIFLVYVCNALVHYSAVGFDFNFIEMMRIILILRAKNEKKNIRKIKIGRHTAMAMQFIKIYYHTRNIPQNVLCVLQMQQKKKNIIIKLNTKGDGKMNEKYKLRTEKNVSRHNKNTTPQHYSTFIQACSHCIIANGVVWSVSF